MLLDDPTDPMSPAEPVLLELSTPDAVRALVWRFDHPMRMVSSASVGEGVGVVDWVCNVQVPLDFERIDLDAFVGEVVVELGLVGAGVGLLTATGIEGWERACDGGVTVDATIGVSKPTWAAASDTGFTPWRPGTINVVAQLPVAMTDTALVGAVVTITEAKVQALHTGGVPGTGTASDAVVVLAPTGNSIGSDARSRFAGPRSEVGARLARATFEVVGRRAGSDPRVDVRPVTEWPG